MKKTNLSLDHKDVIYANQYLLEKILIRLSLVPWSSESILFQINTEIKSNFWDSEFVFYLLNISLVNDNDLKCPVEKMLTLGKSESMRRIRYYVLRS